jgi:hypothetical protein
LANSSICCGTHGGPAFVEAVAGRPVNTESCELEVLTTAGRHLWKQWLGDPLMSNDALEGALQPGALSSLMITKTWWTPAVALLARPASVPRIRRFAP